MDRVIFCPNESMLEDAEKLSRKFIAPILIGDNERTKNLDFNRTKPIPISIPVNHYIKINPENPKINDIIHIEYVNDFLDFYDSVDFTLFNPIVQEPNGHIKLKISNSSKHHIKTSVSIGFAVTMIFYVWYNGEKLHSFNIEVKDCE